MLGLMAGSALSTLGTIASVAMVKLSTSSGDSLFKTEYGPLKFGYLAVGTVALGQMLASWSFTEITDKRGFWGEEKHLAWAATDFAISAALFFGPMALTGNVQFPSFDYMFNQHPGIIKNIMYVGLRNSMEIFGLEMFERHSSSAFLARFATIYSDWGSYIAPAIGGVYHLYKYLMPGENIGDNPKEISYTSVTKASLDSSYNSAKEPAIFPSSLAPQFNFNVKNCVNCKFITSNDNEQEGEEVLFDKCTMRQMVEELLKEKSAIDYDELEKAVTNDNMGQVNTSNESVA